MAEGGRPSAWWAARTYSAYGLPDSVLMFLLTVTTPALTSDACAPREMPTAGARRRRMFIPPSAAGTTRASTSTPAAAGAVVGARATVSHPRRWRMEPAIQDLIPHNHCWGCGTLNPHGLHLKSHVEGDDTVCRFTPRPEHMAGPTTVVYGGILAAVVDCHCVCTAIADAYRAAGQAIGSEPHRWAVTASLRLDYLAPTPLGEPLELRALVREVRGRKRVVECVVRAGGRETVRAEVMAVEV